MAEFLLEARQHHQAKMYNKAKALRQNKNTQLRSAALFYR